MIWLVLLPVVIDNRDGSQESQGTNAASAPSG